ncbi:MAG: ferritin [Eubacteriales bacterium]|nr:ferritin [Eubacteriales bacterium]
MDKKINKAFNDQINRELYSAYLYQGMYEFFKEENADGMANWMDVQVKEEITHAKGLIAWVQMHNGKVEYAPIEGVTTDYDSALDVFKAALEHEQYITKNIKELAEACQEAGDRASYLFLDWYVMEQVEEEENARQNIAALEFAGDDKSAILTFDSMMAGRTFVAPAIPHIPPVSL